MHIARMLRGKQRSAGYVRKTSVWRLNTKTGEYRKRRVNRRVKYMKGHRGFLSVNDGVAAAADIQRLVEYHTRDRDWFDEPVADQVRRNRGEPRYWPGGAQDDVAYPEEWSGSLCDVCREPLSEVLRDARVHVLC